MARRSSKRKGLPAAKRRAPVRPQPFVESFPGTFSTRVVFQALLIAAAVLWIYRPVVHGAWLWDDDVLVYNNDLVGDPRGWWKIWFQPNEMIDFQPLTFTIRWLEWHLWNNDTLGYHIVNVGLHLVSSFLVWRLLAKFNLRLAWLGGLIFAIHPTAIESVAWIAELKNTLSLPFFLLAMCFYLDYDERGKEKDYFLALGLFLAALLCKATMVMFPAVILLYAWWKRGRIGAKDLLSVAPFLALSILIGWITIQFLHRDSVGMESIPLGGFLSRWALAGLSLAFYLSKCLLPVKLMPIYPQWHVSPPRLSQFLPWPLLLGIIYGLWTQRAGWGRHALLGLGFFLINLVPFLGFTPGSYMTFTWVMDHILYLPLIGLIGLAVAGFETLTEKVPRSARRGVWGVAALAIILLVIQSHRYAGNFVNEQTLWTYEVERDPAAWLGRNNLGVALKKSGRLPEAIEQLELAIRENSGYALAYNNLGNALMESNRMPEAIAQYKEAIQIRPNYASAHNNLGNTFVKMGDTWEAIAEYEKAIQFKPRLFEAHYSLANAFRHAGRLPEAIEEYVFSLQIRPTDADAHNNLGITFAETGRIPEAMNQFEQALQINPGDEQAGKNMARLQGSQTVSPPDP